MIETNQKSATPSAQTPSLGRRLSSMLYESLVLAAALFFAAFVFILFRNPQAPGAMPFFQIYLILVIVAYFTWFWTHGGQTVAMKTWRFRVETREGRPLKFGQALWRLVLAGISVFSVAGILWALFDRDRQFLHDRLARTQLKHC